MMYNMWPVFTFVALWHDIELKLLAWGWLICLFLMPELIASNLFSYKKVMHAATNSSNAHLSDLLLVWIKTVLPVRLWPGRCS